MSKITIFNTNSDLDYIAVGETITLKKDPITLDPSRITAFYNGQEIGHVGATVNSILPGCDTNKDIYDAVPDEFTGVVTKQGSLTRATMKVVLEVELSVGNSSSGSNTANGNRIFTFSINGSSQKYKGKANVISEVSNGRKVFLQLRKITTQTNDELVVVFRMNNGAEEICGKIDESKFGQNGFSSLEDFVLIKSILDTEVVEGVIASTMPTSFTIQIAIANNSIAQFQSIATKKAIGGVKVDLVNQGFEEVVLDEIEDYLTANHFTATEIQEIFKSYKKYDDSSSWRIIRKPKVLFNDNIGALKICYAAFLNNFHLLLSGDKGTGKNCLASTWAWILQRPFYSESINKETDKLDMLGANTIQSKVDETSGRVMDEIVFSPEVLLEAMEVGGIINIDEINFADPGITGLLHGICDDRREIEVPGYKKVVSDENFFVIGTMNIDYQGTNELNEALADRFIDIRFPANESIVSILNTNCPKNPQSEIQIADNIYKQMYETIQNRDSSLDSNCLTVRGFIQALNMSPVLGLKKALEVCVADKIKDEEYCQNVKTIIEAKCK